MKSQPANELAERPALSLWRELGPYSPEIGDFALSPEQPNSADVLSPVGFIITWLWPLGVELARWLGPWP